MSNKVSVENDLASWTPESGPSRNKSSSSRSRSWPLRLARTMAGFEPATTAAEAALAGIPGVELADELGDKGSMPLVVELELPFVLMAPGD